MEYKRKVLLCYFCDKTDITRFHYLEVKTGHFEKHLKNFQFACRFCYYDVK
jgi:hypothetical protein